MIPLLSVVLAASTIKSIGVVIAVLVLIGFVVYVFINVRSGRAEAGSEIELAPNRKPYFDDAELEGRKLDRSLLGAFGLMAVIAIGLPLYWLNEPGRQDGAIEEFDRVFVTRGEELFATTADGGFNCAGCHGEGAVGGSAPYTLTDENDEFVATVNWKAPSLQTVLLRFSEEEVRDIIVYGRPFSPMSAWGIEGGGPLNEQQIDNLIAYIGSIQLTSEESKANVEEALRARLGLEEDEEIDYDDPAVGEALFNLGRDDGFAGGAYACARCHTRGWSIDPDTKDPEDADISEFVDYPDGSGAFGPSLRYPEVPRQFLTTEGLVEFLTIGSERGIRYGQNGQGNGRMPGYGDNPNTVEVDDDGQVTQEMIEAIADYVETFEAEAASSTDTAGEP
jgi:mono/diheme cytochrome c family protein